MASLLAGWAGHAADPAGWQVALLAVTVVSAATWIRLGHHSGRVEWFGPWVLLGVVTLAVAITGGPHSPFRPLYLVVVLYGAAFLPSARFLLLATGAMAATLGSVLGARSARPWAEAAVSLLAWGSASVFTHILVRRLNNAAQTDGLTGLWNHAAFWRRLHAEDARARRSGGAYSVLMIDVDHFKKLNDRHGHQAGDAVLRRMADVLAKRIRGSDVLARYGGEEFAVMLPDTQMVAATEVAEKLRRLLVVAGINVSIGVADNDPLYGSADEVMGAADAALYSAKAAGRARVHAAGGVDVVELQAASRGEPAYLRASGMDR